MDNNKEIKHKIAKDLYNKTKAGAVIGLKHFEEAIDNYLKIAKPRILIVLRGGNIQHVAATENIDYMVIDHDNLSHDLENAISELDCVTKQDQVIELNTMLQIIEATKIQYGIMPTGIKNENGEEIKEGDILTPNEIDVCLKDEGDFIGVIMLTDKAKKIAFESGFKNQYDFMPKQFRIDINYEDESKIKNWCENQKLTYEEN